MKGGCDSGFRRVTPESYKKRLFHIVGERKKISVTEIPLKRGNLNGEDVFVIDCGLRIYQVYIFKRISVFNLTGICSVAGIYCAT